MQQPKELIKIEKSKKIIKTILSTPNFCTIGPFTVTSGQVIPIYPDFRTIFSDPKRLKLIAREVIKFIQKRKIKFDIFLGCATAGVPLAVALGLLMKKPVGYVRKKPKEGGMRRAVEGGFKKGMRAILIDDALAQGKHKQIFLDNIRKEGLKASWVIVVASRGHRTKYYLDWIKKAKVRFQSFCDLFDLADYAEKHKIWSKEACQLFRWYSLDAEGWHKDPKKWEFFKNYLKKKKHLSKMSV
jgi:orotate phosphoribosyltransferase